MASNERYTLEGLYFSKVYGSGVYISEDTLVANPIGAGNSEELSPLLVNVITGERFYAKRLECKREALDQYISLIRRPAPDKAILWPSDLVYIPSEESFNCRIFVANQYTDNPVPAEDRKGSYALLFSYDSCPHLTGFDEAIGQACSNRRSDIGSIRAMNYTNPAVQSLAFAIVYAFWELNQVGYIYCDVHNSRFFLSDDGRIILDFSGLVFSRRDLNDNTKTLARTPASGWFPVEFFEPSYVRGKKELLDEESQNYSLCALLFYLFFGRHAYDGVLQSGHLDDSTQSHYIRFRDYYTTPIFIFDPDNRQNEIGLFAEDQSVIDLWENCPEELRRLFLGVLCRYKEDGKGDTNKMPGPKEWLGCFNQIGWFDV